MKAIWITDIHATISNLDLVEQTFNCVESLILSEQAEAVIITGDILDSKAIIRSEVQRCILNRILNISKEVVIVVGNHDFENKKLDYHALHAIDILSTSYPKIKVAGRVVHGLLGDKKVLLIPYMENNEELLNVLSKYEADYVFSHNGVLGATFGCGIDDTSLSVENYAKFKRVFCGHYHKFQVIKPNVVFLGPPFTHSFSESDNETYIGIIDLDTGKLKKVATQFRKHRTIEIYNEEDLKKINEINKKDVVRVLFKSKALALRGQEELKIQDVSAAIMLLPEEEKPRIEFGPRDGQMEIVKKYIAYKKPDLDTVKLTKLAKEIVYADIPF